MAGTVPSSKNLVDGTVPSTKNLVNGTVPSSKNLLDGTSKKSGRREGQEGWDESRGGRNFPLLLLALRLGAIEKEHVAPRGG